MGLNVFCARIPRISYEGSYNVLQSGSGKTQGNVIISVMSSDISFSRRSDSTERERNIDDEKKKGGETR